ncbi:MAG: TonB-dependent receptor [Deltaproteobacteria bacterium]|nr:TonB-dependent receptor [Deltaproteobacteria bacterium]
MRLLLAGLLLATLSVPRAFADSANADAQADAGPKGVLTKPPALVTFVPAPYPPDAEAQHLQGEVVLQVDIDDKGHVADAQVLQGAGHGFDEAALGAVKQFVFSPAEIDNAPAPVRIQYRYSFTLAPETPDAGPEGTDAGPPEPKHQVTFEGRALERGTRKPLAFADVVVAEPDGGSGSAPSTTKTDEKGHFEFEDLPPGTYSVVVSLADHQRFETQEAVAPGQATHATYYVMANSYSGFESTVTAERVRKEVARTTLSEEEIRLIPGTQGDALKVVENLPGVARAPYGIGLLIVRGSKPWDTRVYIDDAVVPQLFHFGGLTSVYNADLLQDITFSPGNFNVDHGRAIGGLITAASRPPDANAIHGYVNANVIDASVLLEGPINDQLSFAIAGRRSYIDALLNQFLPKSFGLNFTLAPRYYDYQARLDWHPPGKRDHLTVTVFGSDDALALLLDNAADIDPEARASFETHIGFHVLSANWTHKYTDNLTQKLSLQTGLNILDNSLGEDIRGDTRSSITAVHELFDWQVLNSLTLEGGLDVFYAPYKYTAEVPAAEFYQVEQLPDPITSRELVSAEATGKILEPSLLAQAFWQPTPKLRIIPGVRLDWYEDLHAVRADPRIAAFQQLGETTTLKAAVGLYHQPPDYRLGLTTPKLGNPDLQPEGAEQYMLGVEHDFGSGFTLDVQGYFKWLFAQVQTTDAIVVRDGVQVPERYDNGGVGRSYGLELLFRKQLTRNLFGWVSYSLEHTEVCNSQFTLNNVRPDCSTFGSKGWSIFPLDQPHHLIAILSYKLPQNWIVGVRGQYASGNPVTPVTTSVYDADGDLYIPIPGDFFSERVPAFFQLDARVDKRFVFEKWMLTLYLDVQNITNRRNPEYTLYNFDYTKIAYLSGLPIIPSFGVKGEF